MEIDLILKKKSCNKNFIKSNGFNNGKIIFIPFTKAITLHVGLTIINVKRPGFELIMR